MSEVKTLPPDASRGVSEPNGLNHTPLKVRATISPNAQGSGFRVQGSGFRVQGLGWGFRLKGSDSNVQGAGCGPRTFDRVVGPASWQSLSAHTRI